MIWLQVLERLPLLKTVTGHSHGSICFPHMSSMQLETQTVALWHFKKETSRLHKENLAAVHNGGFVGFFSPPLLLVKLNTHLWPSVLLSRPPLPVGSLPLSTSCSLSKNACQLVAISTLGFWALIGYWKAAYRCQAIHVAFLRFPSFRGGVQMRNDGSFPHERTHTPCAASAELQGHCLRSLIPHRRTESQGKHYWPLKIFLNSRNS